MSSAVPQLWPIDSNHALPDWIWLYSIGSHLMYIYFHYTYQNHQISTLHDCISLHSLFPHQLLLGGWLNAIGLVIRYISSLHKIIPSDYGFTVVLVGQSVCAIAQPFLLFAPTKLAAKWFPDNHRAIANTIGSTSNPVGLLLAFALCPVIVKTQGDIPNLVSFDERN